MHSSEPYILLKHAELSIKKFNDIGIPHHLGLLRNHKSNIEKSLALSDWEKVQKEEINATRVVKQLKNLMLEMDVLRGRIAENDLDQFDELTLPGRQKAKEAIQGYIGLKLKTPSTYSIASSLQNPPEHDYDSENNKTTEVENLPQIQAHFNNDEHQLRSREACLHEYENLQREIEDIHDIFHKLNGHVVEQREDIVHIEENVDVARVDVMEAEKSLKQALTYKKAMYPLCGAILGFCIAGPVGMVAFGLKAGSMAAVGCGVLGATGGAVMKNKEEPGASDERKED